ncbi:MAG: MraZ N-terminal domain-containing protein, partial [Pseudomonadota bacterium]
MVRYFIGSAAHKLDAKGRVSLPADYREVLKTQDSADVFVIVPAGAGVPFHLAFSRQGHERLIERIAGMTFANPAEIGRASEMNRRRVSRFSA